MDGSLLLYVADNRLGIPETLVQSHDELRAALANASTIPGALGLAASELMEMCLMHFTQEEEGAFRVFGMLHDVMAERVRPGAATVQPMLADLRDFRDDSRDQHRILDHALATLRQCALEQKDVTIAKLAHSLQYHEKYEENVVYPTLHLIEESLRLIFVDAGAPPAGIRR